MQQSTGAAAVDPFGKDYWLKMLKDFYTGQKIMQVILDESPTLLNWDSPAYRALLAMSAEGHVKAKSTLQMKRSALKKYCYRAMNATKRTPYLDEIRQKVLVMKLKGEL